MVGSMLKGVARVHHHDGFKAAWQECDRLTVLKHLDNDAPSLQVRWGPRLLRRGKGGKLDLQLLGASWTCSCWAYSWLCIRLAGPELAQWLGMRLDGRQL